MAGAATATYTTEAFMSPGMNGSQHWDYAVPIGPEVGFVLFFYSFFTVPRCLPESIIRPFVRSSGLPDVHVRLVDDDALPGWPC